FAQAVTLDRLGQNDRRLALMLHGRLKGGKNLLRIVAAAAKLPQFFVRQILDEFQQFRILAKEVLANVLPITRFILLILAIDAFTHALDEQARFVLVEQWIPVVAP